MIAKAWLVVKATRSQFNVYTTGPHYGQPRVNSMKITKVTQSKPSVAEDELAFQVEIDLDESWFLDGTATIKASVPARQPSQDIQATVDMPVKGRAPSPAAGIVRHP